MEVALKNLTYLSDFELFKIIISSADNFPGLYRFTSSWKLDLERENYMNLLSFLESCHYAEQGQKWSKSQWLSAHKRIFDLAFGENGRDSFRSDKSIGELLKSKAQDWIDRQNSYSLAVIDINQPVEEICLETSYYVMGSLIRFKEQSVEISYDQLNQTSHSSLKVSFDEARAYIQKTFHQKTLSELFIKADIIAQINFNDQALGQLHFNPENLNHLILNFSGNAPIFACGNYAETLPIRFAKPIGVSNVCK